MVFILLCSLNKPFLSFSGPILEEQKLLILQREIDFHVRRFDTFDKEKHENQQTGRPRSDNSISEWNMGTNNLRANTGISGNGGATHGGSGGVLASTPITTVHRGAGGDSVDRTRNRNQSSQVEQSERIRFCSCPYPTILTIKFTRFSIRSNL